MGLRPSFPTLALLATASLAACVPDTPTGAADPAASLAMTVAAMPILVEGVGFELPESAAYDERGDVYLLSNVGAPAGDDSPFARTNNGFISRLAPDGSVLALRWIEGTAAHPLHSPTGILVVGDVLHVVDREAVKHYDRATGAWLGATPLPATAMLPNDICVGNHGDLYVTDMGFGMDLMPAGGDAIYRIRDGVVTTFAAGTWLAFPNGCTTNGANVIVTSFAEPSTLYSLNASGRKSVIAALPAGSGQIDSVVRVGGTLYVSSWSSGAVYGMSMGGSRITRVLDLGTPADMGYDSRRHRLLVPSLFGNSLLIHPLD
jgi:hypothetical protein